MATGLTKSLGREVILTKVVLQVPGPLFSDGTIPEADRADARIILELTLEEAEWLNSALCVAQYDADVTLDPMRRWWRDVRRHLKLARGPK